MKHLNPFFITGSLGIVLTAILHMVFALLLDLPMVHRGIWVLYPAFAGFMIIGLGQLLKMQRKPVK